MKQASSSDKTACQKPFTSFSIMTVKFFIDITDTKPLLSSFLHFSGGFVEIYKLWGFEVGMPSCHRPNLLAPSTDSNQDSGSKTLILLLEHKNILVKLKDDFNTAGLKCVVPLCLKHNKTLSSFFWLWYN